MLTSLYNSEPKGNILIVIFIYVAASESTLQDSRLDTLNSQIHLLLKKSNMATMVPKWLPVIDMGVISLSSEFQPCSSSNS